MAAVLAGGPGTVLSHHSAAALWDLRADRRGELPHISVPGRRGHPGTPRVVIHRPEALGEADFTRRRGIPVTSLERTLVDLALFLRDADLKAALREAEFRYRLDLAELRRGLDGHPRSRKHARLRRLLDEWVPGIALTESELEALFLELCARARLPLPSPQVRLGRHRADFLWPAARLVVEVDGYEGHRGRIAFTEDRVKDRRLVARGYVVLRFTRAEVVARPAAVAKEMRAALKRLSAGAQAAL
jgi:very-short-patch-repair endonuclease